MRPALRPPRCDVPPVSPPGERCIEAAVGQSAGALSSSPMSPSASPSTRCVPSVAAVGTVLRLGLPCRSRECEPSKIGFGAMRCRRAPSNRGASLRSSASARVISALCRHRAGDGALPSTSSSTRCEPLEIGLHAVFVRFVLPRSSRTERFLRSLPVRECESSELGFGACPFRVATIGTVRFPRPRPVHVALPMSPSTTQVRPFQCGLRHGKTVTSGRSTSS
jgi:hypothetical protein